MGARKGEKRRKERFLDDTILLVKMLVDRAGFEPTASAMRGRHSYH